MTNPKLLKKSTLIEQPQMTTTVLELGDNGQIIARDVPAKVTKHKSGRTVIEPADIIKNLPAGPDKNKGVNEVDRICEDYKSHNR